MITQKIHLAQKGNLSYEIIYTNPHTSKAEHEFLFFIKPELTLHSDSINLESVLQMMFEKFGQYSLNVKDIRLLGASYLEEYNIIAQHYGVINSLSKNPLEFLSHEAIEKFKSIYGKSPEEVKLLGGIELLERYPRLNPYTLDDLWQSARSVKLAGGAYCAMVTVQGENIYLINGFHPRQIIHFTETGRSIVSFTLTGDLDWSVARNKFIGKTNPADALPGSLRNDLLKSKETFGIQAVTSSMNGFHLSAGPVEGLVELMRYCSDFASGDVKIPDDFIFGRQLKNSFSEQEIGKICHNQKVIFKGEKIRVFDLTEEKNNLTAIQLLKESTFV